MNPIKSRYKNTLWILFFIFLGWIITYQNVSNIFSARYVYSDSSVYQLVARTMLEGGAPYKDIFDHKGIFLYFINALAYLIHPRWGIWFLEWCCMSVNCILAFKICRFWLSRSYALLIICLCFSNMAALGYWIGNTPESWSLVFLLLTEYLFLKYFYNGILSKQELLCLGVSGAILLLMKPTLAIIFPIYIPIVLYKSFRQQNWIFIKNSILWFLIGMAIIFIPSILYLLHKDAFSYFIKYYWNFNLLYGQEQSNLTSVLHVLCSYTLMPVFLLTSICLTIGPYLAPEKDKNLIIFAIHFFAYAATILVIAKPGRNYQQYTLILYPLVFPILSLMLNFVKNSKSKYCFLVVMALPIVVNVSQIRTNINHYHSAVIAQTNVITYIEKNSSPDEPIAVVTPDDCWVYLISNRPSATKFPYTQAYTILNDAQPDLLKEYYTDIDKNRPLFIIANKNDWYKTFVEPRITTKYEPIEFFTPYIIYKRQ